MAGGKKHGYAVNVQWTGNVGKGTTNYRSYERSYEITTEGKPTILGSADPTFRGDPGRYNPEEFLVASLSACHMLWYLHLCSDAKIIITAYSDNAAGTMAETPNGGGHFTEVVLKPVVTVQPGSDLIHAERLHRQAHERCFIANSVNFPIRCEPSVLVKA
ncbi:MAG: OsmC family protein [Cyanobacteria bacterium P01_D01_bin.156]